MSMWTYVRGVVFVDMFILGKKQYVLDYAIEKLLDSLPDVTGSEGSMTAQAVKLPGYNTSWGWNDDKAQTRYAIVLNGNLRDRIFEQTFDEFIRFMCRLSKRIHVDAINVSVGGDFGKKWETTNARVYSDMWEGHNWLRQEYRLCNNP